MIIRIRSGAFLKGMAEGVLLAKKDPDGAKKAIAKFLKVDDPRTLDAAYGTMLRTGKRT